MLKHTFSVIIGIMSDDRTAVALARLEEKVNSIKEDVLEIRDNSSSMDTRLRKIEDWRIWILGWTTAISFTMSIAIRRFYD